MPVQPFDCTIHGLLLPDAMHGPRLSLTRFFLFFCPRYRLSGSRVAIMSYAPDPSVINAPYILVSFCRHAQPQAGS